LRSTQITSSLVRCYNYLTLKMYYDSFSIFFIIENFLLGSLLNSYHKNHFGILVRFITLQILS